MPTSTSVTTPFRGAVTLLVHEGQQVSAGEVLAIVETMKMEAPLTAPRAGRVARVRDVGVDSLAGGEVVVVVE